MKSKELQIKSVWRAKIERIISQGGFNQKIKLNDRDEKEHMFTYPFKTVDNSLHGSCKGLAEFSHHSGTDCVREAVHGKNNIASSIIILKIHWVSYSWT